MKKPKALTIIRQRHRGSGLTSKNDNREHPLVIMLKALKAFTEGTICLMKTIAEAEDPNAICEQFEKVGLFKLQLDTGTKFNTAIKEYADRDYNDTNDSPKTE